VRQENCSCRGCREAAVSKDTPLWVGLHCGALLAGETEMARQGETYGEVVHRRPRNTPFCSLLAGMGARGYVVPQAMLDERVETLFGPPYPPLKFLDRVTLRSIRNRASSGGMSDRSVRSMTAAGLRRKTDIDEYVRKSPR